MQSLPGALFALKESRALVALSIVILPSHEHLSSSDSLGIRTSLKKVSRQFLFNSLLLLWYNFE